MAHRLRRYLEKAAPGGFSADSVRIMSQNALPSPSPSPIDWRLALLIFLAVLALSLPQAALLPLLDRDEPRFAEASREMLQSGNYIVPTFNHEPRYAKPPLIYWCQAASFTIFGENAFAARLPSLLATAATAVLLLTWGMRLGSANLGVIAALSYAFCLQTIQQGRVATADALLIFFMTLTAFTGWQILRPKTPGCVRPVCFVVLALGFAGGFLAKGPEALLPLIPLVWCARDAGRAVMIKIIVSFLAGLALVLIWAIPAYIETHGDYWRIGMSEGVGERMVTGLQGHGASTFGWYLLTLPYYLVLFGISALPWSPLLLIHRKQLFTAWKRDLTDTYLLLNAALIFAIFTLMVTKLPHYTLPAFPFLALLFARRWFATELNPELPFKLAWTTGIVLAVLTAIIVPLANINGGSPSPVGQLVRNGRNVLKPQTEFAVVDFQEPNAIWEMRRVAKGFGHSIAESEVIAFLRLPGPRAVVLSSAAWDHIAGQVSPDWTLSEAYGVNAAKIVFKPPFYLPEPLPLDLTLVVKP
jgi:4-amino-4-deoxy-L-arabinose transferase-like glycosyltransferase